MNTQNEQEAWECADHWRDRALSGERVMAELRSALEGWMADHGHRCRVCMDKSMSAIKSATANAPAIGDRHG